MYPLKIFIVSCLLVSCSVRQASQESAGMRQDQNYRSYDHGKYLILDTAGFYLYRHNKLVRGEKASRPMDVYYFSLGPDDAPRELTLANLERAFAGNAAFRYRLEAQFRYDKELMAYDEYLKMYKIKYLYALSEKEGR